MSENRDSETASADEIPDTDQLEEPSTEKKPGEEPKAPEPREAAPDHEAVGIGIVDSSGSDQDRLPDGGA